MLTSARGLEWQRAPERAGPLRIQAKNCFIAAPWSTVAG